MPNAPRSVARTVARIAFRTLRVLLALTVALCGALWFISRDAVGGRVDGARLQAATQSPQWRDGKFENVLPRIDGPYVRMMREFFFGGSKHRVPDAPLPVEQRTAADYATPPASGLRLTWLGHSTMILEIDGARVLIDPVWGERVSPFPFFGPKRFFAPPLAMAELPPVDVVVISHDHYDHLDVPTVKMLLERDVQWIVPLGIGAHLESWGVKTERITELDWWADVTVNGLTITATPARHFSGRGLKGAGQTLWAGWAFRGATHRVFYSGDTAMHDDFVAIGERLGPFDFTMIEAGAYDAMWADVHLGPEQAVQAHQLVRGDVMLPVHWGLFDLALHGWTEPMERVIAAAEKAGVRVAAPKPGGMVEPALVGPVERWWPAVPWRTVEQSPVWSSGVRR
jgi:L-ascorbate metabolism protein UlaG (beta-lactamase superfamily)